MKTNRKGFLGKAVLFTIFVLGVFFVAYRGLAQTVDSSQTLEVSPASQEISGDPGKTVTFKASVRNRSNTTLPVSVHIEDFTASGDEGQVALVEGGTYSVTQWTNVTPNKFTLTPNEIKDVTATVTIPKGSAGGRYGSFVFAVAPPETGAGTSAKVSQEIASLFLLNISGPVKQSLDLIQFGAPSFSEYGPIDFSMKFKNTGNIHVKTVGLVNVRDMFNQKTADLVVKPVNIFPGAERVIKAHLDKKFLFGKYTATMIMYYGEKNDVLNATTTFIVLPLRLIAIVVVVLLGLFVIRKRLKKALKVLLG